LSQKVIANGYSYLALFWPQLLVATG